jgi:hypothetical protein
MFVNAGLDLKAKNSEGKTLLKAWLDAKTYDFEEGFEILMKKGCDVKEDEQVNEDSKVV